MAEKCVFNPRLSFGIIEKGFNKSFGEGITATKNEAINLYTNIKERFAPKQARFDQVAIYEYKGDQMYWQGDSMPVADHLRRFTLMLGFQGALPEWIAQAKKDEQVQAVVQDRAKNLKPEQAITYLSKKDPDPNKGVSLQQIVNVNGVLIHQSHLLPFNDIDQISKFINLASNGRGDLSLDDDISGWIVVGGKIDFDNDLPEMMIESMIPEQASLSEPQIAQLLIPIWPQLTVAPNLNISRGLDVSDRVVSVKSSSFWWQLLANQAADFTEQLRQTVNEMDEITSARQNLVVMETVVPSMAILEKPARLDPAGELEPALIQGVSRSDLKGQQEQAVNEVVIFGELSRTVFKTEKQIVRPKQETVKISKREQPTRRLLVGKNDKSNKTSSRVLEVANIGTSFLGDDRSPKMMRARGETSVVEVVEQEKAIEDRGDRIIAGRTAATRVQNIIVSRRSATVSQLHNDIVLPRKQSIREIPELKINLEPLNEKEIPVGQIYFDDNNEAVAWFIVIAFFLITNTKSLQPVKIFTASRGRG